MSQGLTVLAVLAHSRNDKGFGTAADQTNFTLLQLLNDAIWVA